MNSIAKPVIAAPGRDAHKYSRGMVVVIQGAMPGAGMLAARAAMRAGAGYVVLAGRSPDIPGPDALVRRQVDGLEALLDDGRIGALVIGPGLGVEPEWLVSVLESAHPLVIDGDALSSAIVGSVTQRRALTILTPHGAEFDRMFGTGTGTKIENTLAASAVTGAWIVHKGADTVIASPSGDYWLETAASPWLSTAGTGDVLAGLIAARLAATGDATASVEGVWLHTRMADLAGPAFIADDLIDIIPHAIAECLAS
jgi:ADP-dependent NAD(P)H-hydrate dehydratase / NAD(P)H-hydrate epimerase